MRKIILLYLVVMFLLAIYPCYGQPQSFLLLPTGDGVESVNPRVVVADFDGNGSNELVTQVFYSFLRFPQNVAFRVLTLKSRALESTWLSQTLKASNVFTVGDVFSTRENWIVFVDGGGSDNSIKILNKAGVIRDLFTVQGEVSWIEIADIDHDGKNEILLAKISERGEETMEGEINLYRRDGSTFVEAGALRPDPSGGIGAFPIFRVVNLDQQVCLVAEEETTNGGPKIRSFTYSTSQGQLVSLEIPNYRNLLEEGRSANAVFVAIRGEKFLLAGRDKIYKYSVKDGKLSWVLDIPYPFITTGDFDNDEQEDVLVTSDVREGGQRMLKLHVFKPDELGAKGRNN